MQFSTIRRLGATPLLLIGAACGDTSGTGPTSPELASTATQAAPQTFASSAGTQLPVGSTIALRIDKNVTRATYVRWSSSNSRIASVTSTGQVTGMASGSATVKASSVTGTQNFPMNVIPSTVAATATIAIAPSAPTLLIGTTLQLAYSLLDASGNPITGRVPAFKVANALIVRVSASGLITALALGSTTLTVSDGAASTTVTVTVSPAPSDLPPVAPPAPVVTSFSIAPKTGSTLTPGTTRQFSTLATWSDNASRAVAVTYTATGGTITPAGLFLAGPASGTFSAIAVCDCGRADTAIVSVLAAPAPTVTRVTISPKTAAILTGTTQQFAASALWSDGSTTLPIIAYSASGGTVSSAGLYTAPTTAGTYRVILAQSGGTLRDTAVVTVTAPAAATVTRITISPKTASILTSATQQFAASALWSNGSTTVPAIAYTATGGTVSSTGLYTAPATAGTYRVILAQSGGTLRDTAVVTVTAPIAATVTSISISPKTAAIVTGATQQFTASALWSNGTKTVPAIAYSTTGGTVSGTGLYTAPATAGTYRVILAQSGGTLRDTAVVTVTTPPVPAPPSAFAPNVPAGLSLVVDTRFGETNMAAWGAATGTSGLAYSNFGDPFQPGRNITVAGAPYGSDAFEIAYPGNSFGNGVGGSGILGPTGQKWTKIHFALSMWVSSSYSLHSNGEKWLYMYTTAQGDPTLQPTLVEWVLNGTESPNGATWGLEFCPNLSLFTPQPQEGTTQQWGWIYQNSGTPRLRKGVWQNIEISMSMNTPGNSDGTFTAWIDGQLVISRTGLMYRSGSSQAYFDGIRFDGTRGGGASSTPTPPEGQARRFNRLAWYAAN